MSFPCLRRLFTFLLRWLGQGPALGCFDGGLSAGSLLSTSKAKLPFEISAAERRRGQGLQPCGARGQRVTLPGLGPGAGVLGRSWSSWPLPWGASQGGDIPWLQWLCPGRWQPLAGESDNGVFPESFLSACCAAGTGAVWVRARPRRVAGHWYGLLSLPVAFPTLLVPFLLRGP